MKMFQVFILIGMMGISFSSQAEEIDKEYLGVSKNPDLQMARNEILAKAQQETIGQMIVQLIGKDKFTQNQKLIQEKVLTESSKYLLSYKTSGISNVNGQMKMSVQLKIETEELKKSLIKHKLLNPAKSGSQKIFQVVIRNTSGLVLFDQLRGEIQTQIPEWSLLRERAMTKSSIEYLVDASAQTRLAPGRYLQIQGKRCELRLTNDDKIECDLN